MNRQAYIAELTQLLYYMTPWDREAAVAKYDKLLANAEDVDALVGEIGTPMKVAVTLSRGYEASPEPDPNAPKPAAEPEPEPAPESEPAETEEPVPPEETSEPTPDDAEAAPETQEVIHAEPEPETQTEPEPVRDEAPEQEAAAGDADVPEVEAVEISTAEQPEQEAAPEPPAKQPAPAPGTGEDGIFSEIFNAATQAHSVVSMESAAKRRVPRPAVLIPYVIVCLLLGVPVALLLLAVDLLIFALALSALVFGVYLAVFLFSARFAGLGNHLIALGLSVLSTTAAVALSALGIWFMQNAVTGFVGFLVRFGQEHGYREEGSV